MSVQLQEWLPAKIIHTPQIDGLVKISDGKQTSIVTNGATAWFE
jgi:hypothetical protein